MNLLQAFKFLNMVTEDLDGYLEENKKYIEEHKANVKKFADWLEARLPELFQRILRVNFL